MTDEIKLGAEIPVDGKRPEWLKNDEKIGIVWGHGERWDTLDTEARHVHGWEGSISAIRLRADHPYYSRPTADEAPQDSVTITPMTVEEATAALYNIPTLRALGLIREETTLELFEKAYGFMTTRERDVVAAFIEWQDSFSA